jgi:hypothetical protein
MTHLHFRIDHLVEAVCASGEIRHDDAGTFLQRELLNVRRAAIMVERPKLKGLMFVPAGEQANLGATHSTYQVQDMAGQAELGASMSVSPPRVDVNTAEATPLPYRHIEDAYGWSIKEIRSAIMANRSLSAAKALAAQEVIAIKHDDIILIGDGTAPYLGLTGIFKLSNTVTYTVPNGAASGTKVWEDKTAKEIFSDLMGICNAIVSNSLGVESPNMVALPLTSWTVATTKTWGVDSRETAMDRFLEVARKIYPGLQVEPSVKLETAGSGSTKRMAAYDRNPEKVYRDDLVLFEQAPPIITGWQTVVHCHGETAGVRAPKPKSVAYGDGI